MEQGVGLERLRSLLYDAPDPAIWGQICDTFETWPVDLHPIDVGLHYAEAHLAGWPVALRAAPDLWVRDRLLPALRQIRPPPPPRAWPLIRALSIPEEGLLDDPMAQGLAAWAPLSLLSLLSLPAARLTDTGLAFIAQSPFVGHLTRLDLRRTALTAKAGRALSQSHRLDNLVDLDLGGTALGPRGLRFLVHAPIAERLEVLGLASSGQRTESAMELAAAPLLRNLRALDLSHNRVDDVGALALARSPHLRGLRHLDLSHNPIGEAGISAIKASTNLKMLKSLVI